MKTLFTLLLLIPFLGFSQFEIKEGVTDLKNTVGYLSDPGNQYSIEEIIQLPNDSFKVNNSEDKIFFKYNSTPKWFKLSASNNTDHEIDKYLFTLNVLLYKIDFYVVDSNGIQHFKNGNYYARREHSYDHRYPVLPIRLHQNESKDIYIHIDNGPNSWIFPIHYLSEIDFFKKNYYDQFYLAIYYGFILLIIVINCYLYTRIKRKVLLYYIGYLICFVLFQMLKDGFLFEFFFSDYPGLNFNMVTQIIMISIIFNILFFQSYFNSRIFIKKYNRYLNVLIGICIAVIAISFFDILNDKWIPLNAPLTLLGMISVSIGAIKMLKKNRAIAIYYLVGYAILFVGILITILGVIGVAQDAFMQSFMLKITTVVEIMVLTVAIVESFRRRQKDILELALEKQKEVSRLSKLANIELEKQVELNKKTAASEMMALRAQMNPHFTFNSMNSIQLFLINNDTEEAQKYLTKFSRLMRLILEHSKLDRIYIQDEIEALELYLEFESLRFKERFKWSIEVNEEIEKDLDQIPSMLVQPFVENAIWHGLMNKETGIGEIYIKFDIEEDTIICTIEDNGIGREAAREIKEASANKKNKSRGMQITKERLEILNEMLSTNLKYEIRDLFNEDQTPSGTKVCISIPLESN